MTKAQIRELLRNWNDAILRCEDVRDRLSPRQRESRWAGEPPATTEAIAEAERRIGRRLPREYRALLEISNGWRFFHEDRHLLPAEEIDLLSRLQPELVKAYTRPLPAVYPDAEETDGEFRASHYATAIQISADGDGFYLMDPLDKVPGGWAIRFFANWLPGADEVTSLGDRLQARFDAFCASHGLGTKPATKPLKLHVPPAEPCMDPQVFLDRLTALGYFDRTPAHLLSEMREAFLRDGHLMARDFQLRYRENVRPLAHLLRPETGRLAPLEEAALASGGVRYAIEQVRPLLAARGVELPGMEETRGEIRWEARLGDTEVCVCRMKSGKPHGSGMEHPANIAAAVVNATVRLLNSLLRRVGLEHRIAGVHSLLNTAEDPRQQFDLLLVTDEQSYELMWTGLGGCHLHVLRADVL